MVLGELDRYLQKKKMKLDHQLTSYTKIKSRWMKDLNISYGTIKTLEENIGKFQISKCSNIFTDISILQGKEHKGKNKQMDLIKIKSFCTAKENVSKMKREPTIQENIFANDNSDKGLISKIYKELTQLHSRRQTTQLKNGQRT